MPHDALLLIAHGSNRYPDAARLVLRHAEALRMEGLFRQVAVGLLNGAPSVNEALAAIDTDHVSAVPFFMEAGYFTNVAIPRAIGNDPRVRITAPIGVHSGIADIITRQASATCERLQITPADAALLVVGHGSATNPGRNLALYDHVAKIRGFGRVSAACLEEAPFLPDSLRALANLPVLVAGFFAGEGMHVQDDVPAAIAAELAHRDAVVAPVEFLGPVAADPAILDIVRSHAKLAAT